MKENIVLETVEDLINHLRKFPANAQVIIDVNGNTCDISRKAITLWDDSDKGSPVAIFVGDFVNEVVEILEGIEGIVKELDNPESIN